uniref:Uncharacterized protein n=1 Tax=Setaria digitata TaxID=48799 RepID=A0A915PDY3_9BILA
MRLESYEGANHEEDVVPTVSQQLPQESSLDEESDSAVVSSLHRSPFLIGL